MLSLKQFVVFLAQLLCIWAIYMVSVYITDFYHLTIPASVLGMVILFFLLASGIVKVRSIEMAGAFLNKHLGFFFVPIAVGLMDFGGLIKTSGLQIFIMIAGSTIVGLLLTGSLTQLLAKGERKQHERHNSF
ncbi:CidA/LrgA family protein [Neobacillus notoginsengisoli]|uniref:CidA/LrgA family protein n=1 Tax=Neobacillus notoginsengisoli TaxID=1578198 RepID=A0A417YW92_9BACI|nr:CidA/LrgA family protein [Neobacillus notoginsengisoli]RHW41652.1 CidA/LrgA family protein [Neobacillus notoginsengisoli]